MVLTGQVDMSPSDFNRTAPLHHSGALLRICKSKTLPFRRLSNPSCCSASLPFPSVLYSPAQHSTRPMKSFLVAPGNTLSVALFTDVTNSKELLDLMQSGKMEPEVALLNASLVEDIFPVLAAAHKALVSKSRETLTTRTLHSELVYSYAASKHIRESLKRCGISDQATYILAARFNASDDEMRSMTNLINGKEIDLEELEPRSNRDQILKHYKVPPQELAISSISDAIICRIAARDAL